MTWDKSVKGRFSNHARVCEDRILGQYGVTTRDMPGQGRLLDVPHFREVRSYGHYSRGRARITHHQPGWKELEGGPVKTALKVVNKHSRRGHPDFACWLLHHGETGTQERCPVEIIKAQETDFPSTTLGGAVTYAPGP